ncbi:MAG: PDZ domain-containing protein [bacterium]|nr:PDZ domain-containing protein [bacterium]
MGAFQFRAALAASAIAWMLAAPAAAQYVHVNDDLTAMERRALSQDALQSHRSGATGSGPEVDLRIVFPSEQTGLDNITMAMLEPRETGAHKCEAIAVKNGANVLSVSFVPKKDVRPGHTYDVVVSDSMGDLFAVGRIRVGSGSPQSYTIDAPLLTPNSPRYTAPSITTSDLAPAPPAQTDRWAPLARAIQAQAIQAPVLGLRGTTVTPQLLALAGAKTPFKGVIVADVEHGGLAERYGIHAGDVIVKAGGHLCGSIQQFTAVIQDQRGPARMIDVVLVRNENDGRNAVHHAKVPSARLVATARALQAAAVPVPALGLRGVTMTPALLALGGAKTPTFRGVGVFDIDEGSPAQRAGIGVGDFITAVNGLPCASVEQLIASTQRQGQGQPIDLTLQRHDPTGELKTRHVTIALAAQPSPVIGLVPPSTGPGYVPPSTGPGYVPPSTGPGYVPPSTGPGYVPPSTGPGYVPPSTGPGYVPPSSGPGNVRPTTGPGFVPPSTVSGTAPAPPANPSANPPANPRANQPVNTPVMPAPAPKPPANQPTTPRPDPHANPVANPPVQIPVRPAPPGNAPAKPKAPAPKPVAPKAASCTTTEYAIPGVLITPTGITSGPNGSLWFTEDDGNSIGQITTGGAFSIYPVVTGKAHPHDIVVGPDGNLWFAEAWAGDIGRITPTGIVNEYFLGVDRGPHVIAVGPDGNLWFTQSSAFAASIGTISAAGAPGAVYDLPARGSMPSGITTGPDGNLWFTEYGMNQIGRITPNGAITEYQTPTAVSGPQGIVVGPDGNLWFAEQSAGMIGKITTGGVITEFPTPTANSEPYGITAGPDGSLWFTEYGASKIGKITTAGAVTECPIPTANSAPYGIAAGPDGNLWFTESAANKIGRVVP